MDRLRSLFQPAKANEPEYAPLNDNEHAPEDAPHAEGQNEIPFSWVEYSIFALLGVAMLWGWNMFLTAAPYFQSRFESSERIQQSSQSAIISISTASSLAAMLVLAKLQQSASYPFRIKVAFYINVVIFALMTLSTKVLLEITAGQYLAFVLLMVAVSAWATGMIQNGAFAFASSFGRPEYMQAIMAGQGGAGVLPPVAQILSVLAAPPRKSESGGKPGGQDASATAFMYFLAAFCVSVLALAAFMPLARRHNQIVESRADETMGVSFTSVEEAERAARKVVGMGTLFSKLRWLAAAIFTCFVVSMFFPVLTPKVLSVSTPKDGSGLLQPAAFIPLAFFFWNLGDLGGRASTLVLPYSRPAGLFVFSLCRLVFLPMYALCNLHGQGAVINSDVFYLLMVQFLFGLTNGWLASNCMMAAADWVDEGELEASGGFMGLCLVAGLAFGSILSFTAAGI